MLELMFKQVLEQIICRTDPGISVEIRDFFKGADGIKEYKVEVLENERYRVCVRLNKYSLQDVKKIFSAFLHFIEYSGASFYLRKNNVDSIEYLLLSANEDKTGFYCQILFLK